MILPNLHDFVVFLYFITLCLSVEGLDYKFATWMCVNTSFISNYFLYIFLIPVALDTLSSGIHLSLVNYTSLQFQTMRNLTSIQTDSQYSALLRMDSMSIIFLLFVRVVVVCFFMRPHIQKLIYVVEMLLQCNVCQFELSFSFSEFYFISDCLLFLSTENNWVWLYVLTFFFLFYLKQKM